MKQQKINHFAVWLCFIAFQLLSIAWYSPAVFANPWMNYLGKTLADFEGESYNGLIYAFAWSVAVNYFMAWLFIKLHIDSVVKGLIMALVIAICFFVLPTFTHDSFSLRPIGLSLINSGNVVLNFCIAGIILGGWRKYKSI